MTDQKLDDLRKWSAELIGWELKESVDEYGNKSGEWFKDGKYTGYDAYYIQSDGEAESEGLTWTWQPDKNLNQTFMVVERMGELGWSFTHTASSWGDVHTAIFYREENVNDKFIYLNINPCEAILLAGKATGVKGNLSK